MVPCLYKAQGYTLQMFLAHKSSSQPSQSKMLGSQAQLSGALEEELGGLQVAKHSNRNLMLSPIKHLKFALDNFTQKTVAHLENKDPNSHTEIHWHTNAIHSAVWK